MTYIDRKRFSNMAQAYDAMVGYLLPRYDDLHESFFEQMKWLREIGYVNVDLYMKYHLWSMNGG